jgi:hypothetical protein
MSPVEFKAYAALDGQMKRFVESSARAYPERLDPDGRVSRATGSEYEHESVYLLSSGTWILKHWSQWRGAATTYRELELAEAVEWFLRIDARGVLKRLASEDENFAAELARATNRGPRAMSAESRANERIALRVTAAQKARIEHLARASGQSVTDFVLSRVL